eukprot:scaffold537_cov223-Chaetoceros_neogracile.AAC.5
MDKRSITARLGFCENKRPDYGFLSHTWSCSYRERVLCLAETLEIQNKDTFLKQNEASNTVRHLLCRTPSNSRKRKSKQWHSFTNKKGRSNRRQ